MDKSLELAIASTIAGWLKDDNTQNSLDWEQLNLLEGLQMTNEQITWWVMEISI